MRRSSILPLLLALIAILGAPLSARGDSGGDRAQRADPARAMVDSAAARKVFSGVRHLLDREDPGWDRETIRRLFGGSEGESLGMAAMGRGMTGAFGGRSPLRIGVTLILIMGGIGFIQAFIVRRHRQRVVDGLERGLARRLPGPLASLLAAVAGTVAPALIPFAFLLALALVHGAWPREAALLDLTSELLWLWVLVTLLVSGAQEALGRRVLGCPQGPARYLVSSLRWLAVFSIVAIVPLYLVERLGAPSDQVRFLWFLYRVVLFLLAAAVLLRKSAVMAVFPDLPRPAYQRFLRIFSASYYPVLLFTLGVAVLQLAGWRVLGAFVWRRTWIAAGVFLAAIAFDQVVGGGIRAALREEEGPFPAGRTPARELEGALLGVLRLAEVIFLAVTWVRLFAADGPIVRLAVAPMFTLGHRALSVWMILQAVSVIVAAILLARVLRAFLDYTLYPAVGLDPGAGSAVNAGLTGLFLLVGTLVAMRLVGIDLKGVAIFTGALGVGVGFGLQHVVNNLVSGLTLIFGRALKPGDWVTVESQRGQIEQVGMRSTRIRSRDNVEFFVPNSTLLQTTIVNWTHDDPRARIAARYLVDSRADVSRVKEILLRVAAAHPGCSSAPAPRCSSWSWERRGSCSISSSGSTSARRARRACEAI